MFGCGCGGSFGGGGWGGILAGAWSSGGRALFLCLGGSGGGGSGFGRLSGSFGVPGSGDLGRFPFFALGWRMGRLMGIEVGG